MSFRLAIVGSGPAGFYTAHQLFKRVPNVFVDIFEKLPLPFGLIRFGVAPDHPEVKNVINQFTKLARSERCRFIGNVDIGKHISIADLKKHYDGIVLAYGAEEDNALDIPGEDLKGVYSARSVVGWYNGVPEQAKLNPDLSGDTAVIIGHGNVALDVARMLLSPLQLLETTDICSHALDELRRSNISRVVLVGRRGPLQVAFTIKELREMIRLPKCKALLRSEDFDECRSLVKDLVRPRKRITELMIKTATESNDSMEDSAKSWELRFLSSPVELLSTSDGHIKSVRIENNRLTEDGLAVGTGLYEEIDCSLLVKSVGYRSTAIDTSIPFDSRRGIIPNKNGRVVDPNTGNIIKGMYCSGWVKRGPVGVIVTTMNDAFETAEVIANDISEGVLASIDHPEDVLGRFKKPVLFQDWERIDEEEQRRGKLSNKPREKLISVDEILKMIK